LLAVYAKLREKNPINVPELIYNPTNPKNLDILCGFLCLTPFFSKEQIMKLFLTLPLQDRIDICFKYFVDYESALSRELQSLE